MLTDDIMAEMPKEMKERIENYKGVKDKKNEILEYICEGAIPPQSLIEEYKAFKKKAGLDLKSEGGEEPTPTDIKLDLNKVNEKQIMDALPNDIKRVEAKNIIKKRNELGGKFTSWEQVKSAYSIGDDDIRALKTKFDI